MHQRAKWLSDRKADLLPVTDFHVVFTVPDELARVAFHNKELVYGILLRAAAETLPTIARDPKHLGEARVVPDPAHGRGHGAAARTTAVP